MPTRYDNAGNAGRFAVESGVIACTPSQQPHPAGSVDGPPQQQHVLTVHLAGHPVTRITGHQAHAYGWQYLNHRYAATL